MIVELLTEMLRGKETNRTFRHIVSVVDLEGSFLSRVVQDRPADGANLG
jgi:hypothetical protein